MNDQERNVIETVLDMLHGLLGRSDASEDFRPILQLFPGGKVTEAADLPPGNSEEEKEGIVKFTDKEIKSMPITLQRIIRVGRFNVHVRKRETSYNKFTYELRYRRDGFCIEACGKTKEIAKANFLKKARVAVAAKKQQKKDSLSAFPTTFTAFSMYYFERFRIKKSNATNLFNRFVAFQKISCAVLPRNEIHRHYAYALSGSFRFRKLA